MNRDTSHMSGLIAARLKTVRKRPDPTAPPRTLCISTDTRDSDTVALPVTGVLVNDQIQDLLFKLGEVVRAAQGRPRQSADDLRLVQACIDKTGDAVELLLADAHHEASRLTGELRAVGFFALKTGGCQDVAKNTLVRIGRIIDRAAGLFGMPQASPAIGEVANENYLANQAVAEDVDFAVQISQLTRLDVLAQTRNQFSESPPKKPPHVLKITPH